MNRKLCGGRWLPEKTGILSPPMDYRRDGQERATGDPRTRWQVTP